MGGASGRRSYENRTTDSRSLSRRGPNSSTLWRRIYCMQFLSYACQVPCCRLKSVEPDWKSAWTDTCSEVENGPCIIFKTVENYKTVIPQKVVAVAYTPGVRLTEVFVKRELTVYRDKTNFRVLSYKSWSLRRWSLTTGGRTWPIWL